MLEVIEGKDEIKKTQILFETKLAKTTTRKEKLTVGYPGGSEKGFISWSQEFGIWWVHKPEDNRFWNGFGTEEVQWENPTHSHSLTCEINPPLEGINRKIAGVFAKDENGELFLLHRGKIGGGRPGIGKRLFLRQYIGSYEIIQDGPELSRLALVGAFESPKFVNQVAWFVNELKRIKSTVNDPEKIEALSNIDINPAFSDEFSGTRKANLVSKQITQKCNHGLVVNALARMFENEKVKIGNSRIDLYTLNSSGGIRSLFEAKTDTTSTDIYKAIGQLYYYSTSLDEDCSLIAVFPKDLKKESKEILKKLNIQCLSYEWINNKPRFIDFNPENYV